MKRWADISIIRKLYFVIGTMAVLLCAELITLRFAMRTLSAVRAFVGGEGSWSKAQKNSAIALERYAITRDEADYQNFLSFLAVPEGDHRARLALSQAVPDQEAARAGFLAGRIHPDDVTPMIEILERFSRVSYLANAIQVWTDADTLMEQFKRAGEDYHSAVQAGESARSLDALHRIEALNGSLTVLEDKFSNVLGEGSRWMDRVLVTLLIFAVLTVETVGLSLTLLATRRLSAGLSAIQDAAARIGGGDFTRGPDVRSRDEVGQLGESINRMRELLEASYSDLERRVRERTAELSKAVDENAQLYERASAAVKERDEFFSIASHELRTPLTGLYLRLQVLARYLDKTPAAAARDPKMVELVQGALRQAEHVAALSTQLLDLTRIRLGKFELTPEHCQLGDIIREVTAELTDEAARAGSELRVDTKQPVSGTWDPVRIGQVVRNLLSNSIKYGNGKPIAVELKEDTTRGLAQVVVRDHGRGIEPEDQARIFERFERAKADGNIPGLGLGLFVSQEIVRAHGGVLTVQSIPGAGATFTLELKTGAWKSGERPPLSVP